MANALQMAGATAEPTNFAPMRTDRMFTGLWTNRSPFRDAATTSTQVLYGMGRTDSILDGLNSEISPRLTLIRRAGSSVYNDNDIDPITRFYSFNTFDLTEENIRVLADTEAAVLDITDNQATTVWTKSDGAASTFFLGVGNTLYFTNGVENKQWNYESGSIWNWGIVAPVNAPSVTQQLRPNTYPAWQPDTGYMTASTALSGMVILDNLSNVPSYAKIIPVQGGGSVAVMAGTNFNNGSQIALPEGFSNSNMIAWATPAYGFSGSVLTAGVFQANGTGGVLNASFQNDSGSFGFNASVNWIAVAWEGAGITQFSGSGFTGISFRTEAGDELAFQVYTGYNGANINVPSGFSINESLSCAGMVSADPVYHVTQGVWECYLQGTTIVNTYDDGSANEWFGNSAVFSVFWLSGGSLSTQNVTNGVALIIPTTGTDEAALVFATIPFTPSGGVAGQWGIPTGFELSMFVAACAMGGPGPAHASSPGNRGHGWSCLLNGQTNISFVMDASGNQWAAGINVFAVGAITTAAGGDVQWSNGTGTTGASEPSWNENEGGTTQDGSITWTNLGTSQWQANTDYTVGRVVMGVVTNPPNTPNQLYVCSTPGTSGSQQPVWQAGVNLQTQDGGVVWTCLGQALDWSNLGPDTPITAVSTIVDLNGFMQSIYQSGVSGPTEPDWQELLGALTTDGTAIWQNMGPFAVQATAAVQYGYAFMNPVNKDISEMSPASAQITVMKGNQVVVSGVGSGDPQATQIVIYRTAQGGSTFLQIATIANPGAGQNWTWTDNTNDSDLNTEWQAYVNGEGTVLPVGATCLAYHLNRIFAAVGNVVYISSGPDAIAGTSSGNAGFDTTFTVQSKITRFWACSLGMVVFTVRDAYLILGSATTNDPLYIVTFIEDFSLRSYDAFTVNNTTPMLMLGNNAVVALDPSAGITDIGFPIADRFLDEFDPSASYVTFHSQSSLDTALYVANGSDHWYRMAANNAPESGSAWSPRAVPLGGIGCVQSVEILPGVNRLLMHGPGPGPVLLRDATVNTDNGEPYPAFTRFGAIVLAQPGQLAGLHFITLESVKLGTRPTLALLLGELWGEFETLKRTRQDPTNLPPSDTIYSDRYHFKQNQKTAWCRHFQMEITWPEEDAANELLTYTIFGETWQEMRAQ